MKFYSLTIATLTSIACAKYMKNDELATEGLHRLEAHIAEHGYVNPEKCTLENAVVRREWCVIHSISSRVPSLNFPRSTLSEAEKLNYIDAVKCIGKKPGKTPRDVASGARSRYDDFVVTHILQSLVTHGTVKRSFIAIEYRYLL